MESNEKYVLDDDDLQDVSGGAGSSETISPNEEYDLAWEMLQMEDSGFSGMQKGLLFDAWDSHKPHVSARSFLAKIKKLKSPI